MRTRRSTICRPSRRNSLVWVSWVSGAEERTTSAAGLPTLATLSRPRRNRSSKKDLAAWSWPDGKGRAGSLQALRLGRGIDHDGRDTEAILGHRKLQPR